MMTPSDLFPRCGSGGQLGGAGRDLGSERFVPAGGGPPAVLPPRWRRGFPPAEGRAGRGATWANG
ncbi:hypothetical protein ACWS7J_26600 [Escherichia coli]